MSWNLVSLHLLSSIISPSSFSSGTHWHSQLRHCATSRKVPTTILVDVIRIFHLLNSGVDSASNRNEYQENFLGDKGGRCVGLTNLSHSCVECLEIWKPQPHGTLRACPGLHKDLFYLYLYSFSNSHFAFRDSNFLRCNFVPYTTLRYSFLLHLEWRNG